MRKILIGLVVAAAVVCASCASSPSQGNKAKTALVVLVDCGTGDTSKLFVYYKFNDKTRTLFKAHPQEKINLVKSLAPGSYAVENVETIYVNDGKSWGKQQQYIPFEMKENCVTIFPMKVKMELVGGKVTAWLYQRFSLTQLSDDEVEKCKKYIRSKDQYKDFEILY